MAEFKLGRIKFVWQGDWNPSTSYVVDDVIRNAGQSYICVVSHTSSSLFYTDFSDPIPKWSLVADGQRWTGDWVASTYYEVGDLAKFGGIVYHCVISHTSATYESPTWHGIELDLGLDGSTTPKWEEFASSFEWRGDWTTSTRYRINDFVVYGGTTYVCNTPHISDSVVLESDQSRWDIFNQGIVYLGDWNNAGVRYKLNDLVKYGANLWICTVPHYSSTNFDENNWDVFINGLEFESSWNSSTLYQIGDTVTYGGYSYIAKTNNTNSQPTSNPTDWDVFITGFNFVGDWSSVTDYKVGDLIRLGGYTYVANTDNTNQTPPNGSYWDRLNSGLSWTYSTQTFTGVSGTNLIGTGSSATFDVVRSGTVYSVTVNNDGSGYADNDKIKILGSNLGGITPANDLIITVTNEVASAIDTISWTGRSTSWKTGTSYVLGDIVLYGANSYVCISAHTAASGNRPDNDITAIYWNLLTAGAESNVLTTEGDMFYMTANGAARLPIGQEGDLLRVTNGVPAWQTYGIINNLVYVGPLGVDTLGTGYGLTIDKPWKTIRYACEQIEKGYLNRQAAELLRKNKQFIIKEVTQYVEYTYPATVDLAKTERDAGIVLDAVIYDLSHSGNGSTISAAKEYFNAAGDDYINSTVAAQVTEFVAGLDYLNTVSQFVLDNVAPGSNYQQLNAVTPEAEQIIDSNLTPESGTSTTVEELISLVINALEAGNTAILPLAQKSNTTISVKTGTYNEVLPIVIPNYTAIVGDELRSTVIQPKAAIDLLANDKPKTISVLDHLQTLIPDLVANNAITPTTGNTQTQDTSLPDGSAGSLVASNSVQTSIAIVRDILENGLPQVPAFVLPNPTNYNTTLVDTAYASTGNATGDTVYYGDGLAQIVQNYQFIKDEIAAYLNVYGTWSSYSAANKIKTMRDLSFILDSIQYDMRYGGNRLALVTGRAYYSLNLVQLSGDFLTETVDCLDRLKTIIGQIVTKTAVTPTAGNTTPQVTTGTAGSAGAATFAQERVQDVIDWIDNAEANATVEPYKAWASSTLQDSFDAVQAKRSEIAHDAMLWFKKFHHDMAFDQELAERDAGDVVDAISYDLLFGSNFYSLTAGRRYRSETISNATLIATMKEEVSDNINFIGHKAKLIATAGAEAQISVLLDDVKAQIKDVVSTTLTTVTTSTNVLTVTSTAGMYVDMPIRFTGLPANTTTTATATAVSTNLITLASATGIDVNMPIWFTGNVFGNVVQNQKYFVKTVSGSDITISLTVGGTAVALINGSGTMTVNVNKAGNLYEGKTYWVDTVVSSTQIKITDSYKSGTDYAITYTTGSMTATATVGELPEVNGSISYNHDVLIIQGAEILRANKNFLAYEATAYTTDTYSAVVDVTTNSNNRYSTTSAHPFVAGDPVVFSGTAITDSGITIGTTYWVLATPTSTTFTLTAEQGGTTEIDIINNGTGSMTVTYAYDEASCRRDAIAYVDALIDDLNFIGNYKSIRAAVQYVNAVDGSEMENMFFVGNGTGLRNCTMTGLTGTLGPVNAYGTQRPTAGAYTSLNPGFGPSDRNVWVKERSHYSQNCTMFGTACTGAKIDSALHEGGNKSMVKNDYTTILSDGIGVWCTGADSLVELVSVFNYYGYSGYIAELGGRIRATNGNSSYGTYGVIAEGVDTYEVPLYGSLDNRANDAQVGFVFTDGVDEVLRFEYTNAGTEYTNYVPDISGAGFNATAIGDEFRDSAVFETRLVDLDDGNGYGGEGYLTASNVAQGGDTTSVTIAATDTQLSPAYIGMRCVLTAGTGAGQYGWIVTYNNGSKIAKIAKDSFTTLTVTATSITNDLFTVASTATMYVGMPIYFGTGATNGVTANTLYYVIAANFSSTQFAVSTSAGGSAVTVTANASGLTIPLYAAGWDHVIPGTTIENALDLTTGYTIEPRVMYSDPGFTSTARTLSATTTWGNITYADSNYVAITSNGQSTSYSTNGTSWNNAGNLPASSTWADVVYGGGQGATATAIIGGLGGSGAVLTVTMGVLNTNGDPLPDQVATVTVVDGGYGYSSPPTIEFTGGGPGSGTVAVAKVLDGVITEVVVEIPGSGYTGTPTATARTDIMTGVTINTYGKDYALLTTTATVTGGGASSQATLTVDTVTNGGVVEISIDDGGAGYTSVPTITILDSNAKFVAVRTAGGNVGAYKATADLGASAWTSTSLATPAGTYAALAYGSGIWVSVGGTASAMSSTDGDTWVARTIQTTTGTWSDVAYGNGTFVAISTGDNKTSYSTNGNTWSAGGTLPSSTTWTGVAYGNGRFVAVASGGRSVAYSLDKGVTWVAVTPGLPSSQDWSNIEYGQGLFMAVSGLSIVAATSPDGINWTTRQMPGLAAYWLGLAFGNPNNDPIWVAASNGSSTRAASIKTGAQTQGRWRVASEVIAETRIWEPGSGYPRGTVSATTTSSNLITVDSTDNLIDSQPIEFDGLDDYGLTTNVTYYVIGSTITSTQFKVSSVSGSSTSVNLTTATGLSNAYRAGPILTQTDPNKTVTAATRVRIGNGVLSTPTISNRGTANTTATASITGDGQSDLYQPSNFINVRGIYEMPLAGANIEFASIPGEYYKLVAVSNILGIDGNFTATWQINPALTVLNAPADGDLLTTRIKYSQVRLTGHDFLYIGTGNFEETNYPYVDPSQAIQANQTYATAGGRVFFTSTDQDGNFNVGNLFGVQQSTGTATLNASAFNLSGLQSLQLGSFSVGTGSAVITQFSTDPYFTANSDSILPTQRAIKSYITSQIGGGQSSLNVNTLTAGVIYVANNTISTTSGSQINVRAKMNFTGGIDGAPVALAWFMQR